MGSLSLKANAGLKGSMMKQDENGLHEGLPTGGGWLYVM